MQAIHLQTESLFTPLGLGIAAPRFYWHCAGGVRQTAYQVTATRNDVQIWDTGKVLSSCMTHILYQGEPLDSRDRVIWSVRLWDENDVPGKTAESWFELGLLHASDWHAQWISGDYTPKKNVRYPADCFRRQFRCEKPVQSARLYATACGLYDALLNGQRAGDCVLAPGCTDYRKRLQYQVYDVTNLLAVQNALELRLADGWYRGSIGCFGTTNVFGRQTKLLCQLEITYTDGMRDTITSGQDFAWSNDGPVRFADLKDGEIYDASRCPSYSGKARQAKAPKAPLTAADNVQPKEQEAFSPVLLTTPSGKKVLDFGQNLAGFLAFSVEGEKGQRVKLTCGEILDENGEFTQKNMQEHKPAKEFGKLAEVLLITGQGAKLKGEMQPTPKQEITFFCSGGRDAYQTAFAVQGFRYALLETDAPFDPTQCKAIAVYSDLEQTGWFQCSNEAVNKLFQNTVWSMKGNFLDVPTDCPTRERLGWTGDAQVFFETGAYLMNLAPFYRKYLRDMQDNQFKNGKISAVVPYNGASMLYDNTGASVGWGDAAVLVPYRHWKRYGDEGILQACYPMMRAYAMFMLKNTGHKDKKAAAANPYNAYTYEKGLHLGEWLEPEEFKEHISAGHQALHTEECTAYLHYTMRHMAHAATALGKAEDAALFSKTADGAKKAYAFLFLQQGAPDTDRQAKLVRPLAFEIAEGETKIALECRLAQAVENRQYRIGTGFLSTPFVLGVLTQMRRADLAYQMLENEQAPGWLYEVKQGATTVWENWEGSASHNHYSPGAVCQWLFDTVAGIRVDGENRFVIAPTPGGTLTEAAARYISPYGTVESGWKKTPGGVAYCIAIPPNTSARVLLPDGTEQEISSGTHQFASKGERQ